MGYVRIGRLPKEQIIDDVIGSNHNIIEKNNIQDAPNILETLNKIMDEAKQLKEMTV